MANYARQRMKQSRYMDQADQAVDNIYKNVKMAHAFFREDVASTAQKSKKRRFFSSLFKVVTLGVFHVLAVMLSAIAYAVAVGNENKSKTKNTRKKHKYLVSPTGMTYREDQRHYSSESLRYI
ncbi:hypothetical protein [Cysteiniphilum halobium]|uniref:hypothetical protein n=1 Tax=Cysteiniphilum halobium TaxID=2219059 RepID=UPI000E64915D|nr:hypothetical protein [Cysteiniphilum halobium]